MTCSQARIDSPKLRIQLVDALAELSQGNLRRLRYVGLGDLLQERLDPGETLGCDDPELSCMSA